jgi:hypothetical protein
MVCAPAALFIAHRSLTHLSAIPCDSDGNFLPPGTPPSPRETAQQGDWTPFDSEVQFKIADLLYHHEEMSATNLDTLFELLAQMMSDFDASGPFESHQHMYNLIDSSVLGDIPWQCLVTELPLDITEHSPTWMRTHYEIWHRNPEAVIMEMLANPDFEGQFDLHPYIDLDASGKHQWGNVMSGNVAWQRCVSITIPSATGSCLDIPSHRIRLLQITQTQKGQCTAQSYSGVIRPQSQSQQDM